MNQPQPARKRVGLLHCDVASLNLPIRMTSLGKMHGVNFFDGNNVRNASAYEQTLHEQIMRGTMPASKVRRLLNGVNSIKVWESQIDLCGMPSSDQCYLSC